eukprot:jgi/Mesvir1/12093/Mv00367-RA.1
MSASDESQSSRGAGTVGYRFNSPADLQAVKDQRRSLWEWLKVVGAKAFEGANLTKLSLPVTLFEPRSWLERITDNWAFADYLFLAAECKDDPVQRLKYIVCFALAGLSKQVSPHKPFNPILGETYQAEMHREGSDNRLLVFAEQTSHHPPVSKWEVYDTGKRVSFTGTGSWSAQVYGNAIKGHQDGQSCVAFPSDGAVVSWELPDVMLKGILWGERYLMYQGKMTFRDDLNRLRCEIVFDPVASQGSYLGNWWNGVKSTPDEFAGQIVRVNEGGEGVAAVLAQVAGNWLSHIEIDKKRVWEISSPDFYRCQPSDDPLPSDCRFRDDLCLLREGKLDDAQKAKETLEELQRKDRQWRQEGRAAEPKAIPPEEETT